MPSKIPVAIVGATGYTGVELVRLLVDHPGVSLAALTSRENEGKPYASLFPAFAGRKNLVLSKLEVPSLARKIQVAFLCLPHHESMTVAADLRSRGIRVIDLSADFRLKDAALYEKWYGRHTEKNLLTDAVYGLPELHRDEIRSAKLVAAPGCYPTSILLALAPFLKERLIDPGDIICDSKSGTSGAGRTPKTESLFCEVHENFRPYNIDSHRHVAEINQELSLVAGEEVSVLFSPHLLPIDRGILSTIYVKPIKKLKTADLLKIFAGFYRKEPFVQILSDGTWPATKNVRGTNLCQITVKVVSEGKRIVIVSAIDNLTKGASGQAVQCFNLMVDLPETTALELSPLIP